MHSPKLSYAKHGHPNEFLFVCILPKMNFLVDKHFRISSKQSHVSTSHINILLLYDYVRICSAHAIDGSCHLHAPNNFRHQLKINFNTLNPDYEIVVRSMD